MIVKNGNSENEVLLQKANGSKMAVTGKVIFNNIILTEPFISLTRPLPFSDKRSVPACYHGGKILTLDSDFDVHRSRRNKQFER